MHYFKRALMLTIVNNKTGILTQVDDSGQWIPKDPSGKMLPENHQNSPEPAVSGPDCSSWDLKMWSINYN